MTPPIHQLDDHLSETQLCELADGLADPNLVDHWLDHLDQCTQCASRFESSTSHLGSLANLAREAIRQDNPVPDESGFKRLDRWLATGLAAESQREKSLLLNPPSQIGQYKLGDVIGRGGMGTVYQATHIWLHRDIALKLMRVEDGIDPNKIKRFTQEFEAIGRLDHPNIICPIDAGCLSGQAFLAMELVDGLDLGRIRRTVHRCGSSISPADVAEIVYQAAAGLHHAHQNGIIHRDVKPSNLMLARSSSSDSVVVKVMDLGLVQMESAVYEPIDDRFAVVGTEGYRSPQQQRGDVADRRCDVYSLGATMKVLLVGKPSTSSTTDDWIQQANETGIDAAFVTLANRMTADSPNQRPVDMQHVMSELQPLRQRADLQRLLSKARADEIKNPSSDEEDFSWSILTDRKLGRSLNPVSEPSVGPDVSIPVASNSLPRWLPHLGIVVGLICLGFWFVKRNAIGVDPLDSRSDSRVSEKEIVPQNEVTPFRDDPDREVVRQTLAMGGRVDVALGRAIERTIGPNDEIPDQEFKVTWVMLEHTKADDDFLDLVSHVDSLVGIVLPYTDVTDKGVARLGQIKSLECVFLYHTNVTDVGLAPITELPKLRELVISETGVTPRTIERLVDCRTLQRLALKDTAITGASLPMVAKIASLRDLDIREIELRDEDLDPLLGLPKLRDLAVNRTNVTEKGITHVASIETLRLLEFDSDQASEETAQRLRKQYPKLKVVRDTD